MIMENDFRWFRCKVCNKPLLKLTDKSIIFNEIFCRCCKKAFDVEIINGKIIRNIEKPKIES